MVKTCTTDFVVAQKLVP